MTLYLKYRPQDFNTLVGQDNIKNTLKNTILKDKLVGAYIFCGPRGTGKTSTARIFAKAINCLDNIDGNPCLLCDNCKSFSNGNFIDIVEIDAASYTGVDNIRSIIEKASFMPNKAKYKVYIIDEVHMLSKGAFNALLKILEEPPSYLKFILATTEIHKVPETILSRCQRYDFKSITDDDIKDRLNFIAKNENITIDKKSLDFIAKNSFGGLRNAISLFQQLINKDNFIIWEEISQIYGLKTEDILSNFYQKILSGDNSIVSDFYEISKNSDIKIFFKDLLFFIKEDFLNKMSKKIDIKEEIYIFETLEESFSKIKNTFDIETCFLIGVIKSVNRYSKIDKIQEYNKPKIIKKEEKKLEIKEEKIENLSIKDLNDLFLGEEEKIENKNINNSIPFDINKFIENLKLLKAKGSLTMSIRGSKIVLNPGLFTIETKTAISLKNISSSDSISLITQSLEMMGLENIKITIS